MDAEQVFFFSAGISDILAETNFTDYHREKNNRVPNLFPQIYLFIDKFLTK
jgi:hypothetical protein